MRRGNTPPPRHTAGYSPEGESDKAFESVCIRHGRCGLVELYRMQAPAGKWDPLIETSLEAVEGVYLLIRKNRLAGITEGQIKSVGAPDSWMSPLPSTQSIHALPAMRRDVPLANTVPQF